MEYQSKCSPRHQPFRGELSNQAAYWVGFLLADGCIQKGKKRVVIKLASRDKEHLWKLCDFIGLNRIQVKDHVYASTYASNSHMSTLQIKSHQMVSDLAKLGVVPRKSMCETVPCILKTNRHFWRGVIDGDGSVGVSKNRNHIYPKLSLVGSLEVVTTFAGFVEEITGKYPKVSPQVNIWACSLMGETALKVIRTLYTDAEVALMRKVTAANVAIRADYQNQTKANPRKTQSAHSGITYDKHCNRWLIRIRTGGKEIYLGRAPTEQAALIRRNELISLVPIKEKVVG